MAPNPLSAAELLDAASLCRERSPAEAGVYLAALAEPGMDLDACARLPLGIRDSAIAGLHTAMFGPKLDLSAACPTCAAPLDVSLGADALKIPPSDEAEVAIEIDGRSFAVRPIDSDDLAAIADIPDEELAREYLALRCLAPRDGGAFPDAIDANAIDAVAEALAAIDPAADLFVPLACYECGTRWDAPIDIARVLAYEIEAAAEILMDDIHDLALAYHWTEAQILALAPARRRGYLERLRG